MRCRLRTFAVRDAERILFVVLLLGTLSACDDVPAAEGRPAAARPVAAAPDEAPTAPAADPQAIATPLVDVPAGVYRPLFSGKDQPDAWPVAAFALEAHAVTNAQFLAFVRAQPQWRRDRVPALFAGRGYLANWQGPLDPGPDALQRPVVQVSWFAARAYARWIGRRLPSVAEWELAAAQPGDAGGEDRDARLARILRWYGAPTPPVLPDVRSAGTNVLGLHDLHGLVWEWTEDFNSALVTGESRGDSGLERNLFCGSGAAGAADPSDYAAFMRFAFRSSLKADYVVKNLGFRCALSRESGGPPEDTGATR